MLLNITPADALDLVGSPQQIRKDRIIPARFPHCSYSPYQQEYEWLFSYERQLVAFLEQWLKPYRYELIGEKGILCEALSNAFCHGHGKDPDKPIVVRVLLGAKGLIIQIKDRGLGFDVRAVYRRYYRQKQYWLTAGNGLRQMAQSANFGVFHDRTGTISHLLHLFEGSFEHLISHPFGIRV